VNGLLDWHENGRISDISSLIWCLVDGRVDCVDSLAAREISGWLVASESCCFQAIGAELVREVIPGIKPI
jgi:hypothetical protein